MFKKIILYAISLIEKYSEWKLIIIPKKVITKISAVKSDIGFWYTGNILTSSDIAYGIFRNGQVEVEETDLVLNIIKKLYKRDFIFFDVGANSGYYGIMAAFVGKGNVKTYAFEPLKEYVELIKTSVFLNRLEDSFQVFKTALGAENKTGIIQLAGSGSSLVPSFLGEETQLPEREISITKLDTIREKESIPLPDFIKIDVEGYEYEVLQGSVETLAKSLPVLFIEIANTLNNLNRSFKNQHTADIFDLLSKLGYNAFVVNNGLQKVDLDSMPDGVYMYLFLNTKNPLHTSLLNTNK